jgi:hypothetical protein
VQRAPCPPEPFIDGRYSFASMPPAVTDRRFDPTVPGSRRVAIISGPTGGRRCPSCGTLLKREPGARSSWSRSGSFNGFPRPGVARELPFKSHFKGEAKSDPQVMADGGGSCGYGHDVCALSTPALVPPPCTTYGIRDTPRAGTGTAVNRHRTPGTSFLAFFLMGTHRIPHALI